MVRRLSRAQRRAAFLQQAAEAFDRLEAWYDAHPEATFAEIEQEARRQRRTLLGRGLEGESTLERAYYVCSQRCGETFSPPGPPTAPASGPVE